MRFHVELKSSFQRVLVFKTPVAQVAADYPVCGGNRSTFRVFRDACVGVCKHCLLERKSCRSLLRRLRARC